MNKPSTLHDLKKIKAMNSFIHSLPADGAESYTFRDTYSADFLNIFYTESCLKEVITSPSVKTRLDLKLTKEKEDNSRTVLATESKKNVTIIPISQVQVTILNAWFAISPRLTKYEPLNSPLKMIDEHTDETIGQLFESHSYIKPECMTSFGFLSFLIEYFARNYSYISKNMSTNFILVGARAWETNKNAHEFGPLDMHTDGFDPGFMKLMIYPDKLNEDNGAFQIENHLITSDSPGLSVSFFNSDTMHRGVPGKQNKRKAIELTLMEVKDIPPLKLFYSFMYPHDIFAKHPVIDISF